MTAAISLLDMLDQSMKNFETMTTMLMGYKRPSYLKKIERMKTDSETVFMLENSIEQTKPYISDYF